MDLVVGTTLASKAGSLFLWATFRKTIAHVFTFFFYYIVIPARSKFLKYVSQSR
ncbi:mannan synthase 1 [Phtheirospermum japonicum]|uniref:Mannan synthase 1 n=1 Tax=Phtheirospermum japonicum TaxID=374723 RepID=A0A830D0E8_9LAMI|nr:mannan synthase 1 [Phtheirospermum japonicum]